MTLSDQEIAEVAAEFQMDPKLLRAVAQVESGGSGFLSDGRLKILFERHLMRKRLMSRKLDPSRLSSERPDLCDISPGGYGKGGAHQWDRVQAALDWASKNDSNEFETYKKSAFVACSWGAFQLLGMNFKAAGFADVYELKHHLELGHKEQLQTICRWMSTNGLLAKLKAKDWAGFASGYNGKNYAINRYDKKLMAAYENA